MSLPQVSFFFHMSNVKPSKLGGIWIMQLSAEVWYSMAACIFRVALNGLNCSQCFLWLHLEDGKLQFSVLCFSTLYAVRFRCRTSMGWRLRFSVTLVETQYFLLDSFRVVVVYRIIVFSQGVLEETIGSTTKNIHYAQGVRCSNFNDWSQKTRQLLSWQDYTSQCIKFKYYTVII